MINPTVETDLVGDIIQVIDREYVSNYNKTEPSYWSANKVGRGRCRAVTIDKDGNMLLWLEVTCEEDKRGFFYADPRPEIGDVVCVSTESRNSGRCTLHLIKDLSK